MLIRDDEAALAVLHRLGAIGGRITLNIFGSGYPGLSYQQRFPFENIKIDRSFIEDLSAPRWSSSIV